MRNVMLTGVGGQGTVLAAKVLAQAASDKGWPVRTAETIGMAQRGGSVVSHVRMGDAGDAPASPLVMKGTADAIIAFEPAEGARMLPYLAPDGVLVTASAGVQPVTAALSDAPYQAEDVIATLRAQMPEGAIVVVDDAAVERAVGTRRTINTALLAAAVACGRLPISIDDLRRAVVACVKPQFADVNLATIDVFSID